MSLFRRRTRRTPQQKADIVARRNSMADKKRAERIARAKARAEARAEAMARRRRQKPRPTKTRTVDPMPNSPERQRRRNRQPAIDLPKGAGKKPTRPVRPKRDNKMVTPVRRRLANAKRLTNVTAGAKKGTNNIADVLAAAKAAAGRTKSPRRRRGPRA